MHSSSQKEEHVVRPEHMWLALDLQPPASVDPRRSPQLTSLEQLPYLSIGHTKVELSAVGEVGELLDGSMRRKPQSEIYRCQEYSPQGRPEDVCPSTKVWQRAV